MPTPLQTCRLCPRNCGVDRTQGTSDAWCRLGPEVWVYKSLLSVGEESVLRPTWLVDLGGCSLRCVFCSEWDHVVEPASRGAIALTADWFGSELARMKARGATSVSAVGGEPTVSAVGWLDVWHAVPERARLPLVWNSNGLLTEQSWQLLAPEVACWVVDAKTFAPSCTEQLLGGFGDSYLGLLDWTLRHITAQPRRSPLPTLIVRHLLMPGHLACCTLPLLTWLAERIGEAPLNLMTTFVPTGPAQHPSAPWSELKRWNTAQDQQVALAAAQRALPVVWHNGQLR